MSDVPGKPKHPKSRDEGKARRPGSYVPDYMKHRSGPIRATKYNEWYTDKKAERGAARDLSASRGGVPNNPMNVNSFRPENDVVARTNMYRDGEQIATQEGPTRTRPDQRGQSFTPPPVPKEKAGRVKPNPPPRGLSTALGALGAGPQRDVPPVGESPDIWNEGGTFLQ